MLICVTLGAILNPLAQGPAETLPTAPSARSLAVGLGLAGALIEGGLLLALRLERPASHVPEFLAYYLLLSIAYFAACWIVIRWGERLTALRSGRWIWAAALLFRVTVLPLDPSLSEDTARYRWQGMVQHAGGDPYLALPQDAEWESLRDSTWSRVAAKDKPSAYGPVLEQLNLWTYRCVQLWESEPWRQVWLFKFPFALAELGVGLALMSLLAAAGRPPAWALIYLWSPLAVTEFWIEGHNDALGVALVVAALALSLRGRSTWALVLLTIATLCKFWPAVLFPFLALTRSRDRWHVHWRGLALGGAVGVALCLLYWRNIAAVLEVLEGFTMGWRNNDSLFAGLLWLAGGDMESAAGAGRWILFACVVGLRWLRLPACSGELGAVTAVLLLSANCFPWYLSWMLPFLAVQPVRPLLLWTVLAPLAYHVVPGYEATGTWEYDASLVFLEYAPVLAWLGVLGIDRSRHLLHGLAGS